MGKRKRGEVHDVQCSLYQEFSIKRLAEYHSRETPQLKLSWIYDNIDEDKFCEDKLEY